MMTPNATEKFALADLLTLRSDLMQAGLDTFQAGQIISTFLSGRGYGVSHDAARTVAGRVERSRCTVESLQAELEGLALVM